MATGDRHSRLVQIGKITLPLIALGILSTLFMFSGDVDPESAIPYAKVDVEKIAREQSLSNPRFSTVGSDGAAIELSATEARPDQGTPDRVDAIDVVGVIDLPGGAKIELSAGSAQVDMAQQIAGLVGDVVVRSSGGFEIYAMELLSYLDRAELRSDTPVEVQTPFGFLEAGNMSLTRNGPDYRLVFNNKVKLVYDPLKQEN